MEYINKSSTITKTALLLFIEERIANNFIDYIKQFQKENIEFDRNCFEMDSFLCSPAINLKSAYPLSVEQASTRELELTCIMNYFDMFIVSKIEKERELLNVYGFEYAISDLPSRNLIEFNLKYNT